MSEKQCCEDYKNHLRERLDEAEGAVTRYREGLRRACADRDKAHAALRQARNEGIEEAAKAVEAATPDPAVQYTTQRVVRAIRALKESPDA